MIYVKVFPVLRRSVLISYLMLYKRVETSLLTAEVDLRFGWMGVSCDLDTVTPPSLTTVNDDTSTRWQAPISRLCWLQREEVEKRHANVLWW